MIGSRLAKEPYLIDKDAVYLSVSGSQVVQGKTVPVFVTDPRAQNPTIAPDDADSATEFSYLTTDGSDDAPYLKSS